MPFPNACRDREFMARISKIGTRSTTAKKAVAVRKNGSMPCRPGKKRGRPRKTPAPATP